MLNGQGLKSLNGWCWPGCACEGYFGYFGRLREEPEETQKTKDVRNDDIHAMQLTVRHSEFG